MGWTSMGKETLDPKGQGVGDHALFRVFISLVQQNVCSSVFENTFIETLLAAGICNSDVNKDGVRHDSVF